MTADASLTPPLPLPVSARPAGALPPWMPLAVVAVAWAAHGGVLQNGWVWDDAILIRDDASLAGGLGVVPRLLGSPWGGTAHDVGLFRPLVAISMAVQAAISGTADAFPYHLVNLVLHACVATAFLAVLLRVFPRRPMLVAVAALAFAAHPVHTGTISWIVARGDLLSTLFLLLGVLVWTRERATTSLSAALVTGLLWFLALLSKEAAVTFPLALLCVDAAVRRVGVGAALRARAVAYATLIAPAAAWLFLRVTAVGGLGATEANAVLAGRNVFERLLVGCGALVRTAAKLFVPAGLSGDGSNDPVLAARAAIPAAYAVSLGIVAIALVFTLVALLRRRAGPASVAVGLFILLSIPVLQIVPIGAVFEDRFAYLPSLALLVLVGLFAEFLVARVRPGVMVAGVLLLGLAGFGLASWRTAADWRDEETFDRALLAADPGHIRAIDRLSHELILRWQRDRARATAAPTRSDEERAAVKSMLAAAGGRVAEAVALLERARSLPAGRRDPSILAGLGDAYLALPTARYTDALAAYRDLLEIKRVRVGARREPLERVGDRSVVSSKDRRDLAQIHHNIAVAHLGLAANAEAAEAYEASSRWCPPGDPREYAYARTAGAAIWRTLGDPRRALPFLERAALLAPAEEREVAAKDAREARQAAARADELFDRAAATLDRPSGQAEAQRLFEEVVVIDPDFVKAHLGIARVKRWKGDFRGALEALDAAVAALDRRKAVTGAESNAALRREIGEIRTRYEHERDAPADDGK